jgi:hypothetical protein
MYKIVHRILILIIIILNIALGSSTAGSFAENPISVKSLALGGCSATLLDSSAAYKNPAVIKVLDQHAINTMHGRLFNEVNYLNLSYVRPELTALKFGFGFSFLNNSLSGIEETTYDSSTGEANYTGKNLSYSASAYVFSFSQNFSDNLFYGTNLKIYQESLAGESSSGTGADFGLIYKLNDKILLGFSAINIIKPALHWSTGSTEQVNNRFSLGVSYQYNEWLEFFADTEKVENRNPFIHAGVEYRPISFFAFRLGYDKNRVTVGTGLSYNNFGVDYAYVDNKQDEDVGLTQYIAASYIFATKDLSELEKQKNNEKYLQEAISDEQLKASLAAMETIATETAEIEPLPLPESPTASIELAPSADSTISENIPEKVEPIIDTTSSNETVIVIEEEYKEPVHDYSIALMSARYYKTSKRLIIKVFIDNTGNQNDAITCNARLLLDGKKLKDFEPQTTILKNKETKVFYFVYTTPQGLLPGIYYFETETISAFSTKYQKEKFINRKN